MGRTVVRVAAALRVHILAGVFALALVPNRSLAQAQDPEVAARKAYGAGVADFQNGELSKAYEQFMRADQTVASPNIKLMLGRTLAKLSRRTEAYRVLNQALQSAGDVPRYATTARAAREELRELEQQLSVLRLHIQDPSPATSLRVDDQPVERALWEEPMAFDPGQIRVELAEPDGRRDLRQLELNAGSSLTIDLHVPAPSALANAKASPPAASGASRLRSRPELSANELPATAADSDGASSQSKPVSRSHQLRPISYIVAGVGVAGLAAFGILGTLSDKEFSKLQTACPEARLCDARYRDTATRGQTYQTIANVSLGVGVAALASGIVLWLISLPEERAQPPAANALAQKPRALAWTGSF